MNLLFQILRAGHASGTHHKLALDALTHVTGPYAERWQRLILKHATLYLEGSKAPDTQFKDFKNHVLHVRDKLWGGAPEKATGWYQHLLAALRDNNWSEAAWCAGVLSHYYTDPIQPFHTGQSVAENNVHRAVEWSISRSYDKLAALGEKALPRLDAEPGTSEGWLKDYMVAGATRSNAHYEALLAHYDFQRGVVDPPSGLDSTSRAFIGELIQYAQLSFAKILERAFQESAVVPPDVALTAEMVFATLKLPVKAVLKRMDDQALRKQVEAMYDELQATGRVEHAMPEEERVVRAAHAKEVLADQAPPSATKLDVSEALASNKTRAGREHRPVVPQIKPSAASGEVATLPNARARAGTDSLPPTPPAPAVTDFPVRRPAGTVLATTVKPVPVPVASAHAAVLETPAEPAKVTAPLAAAAASAAASALSGLGAGLGASDHTNRLRAAARDAEIEAVERDARRQDKAAPSPAVSALTLVAAPSPGASSVPSAAGQSKPHPQHARAPHKTMHAALQDAKTSLTDRMTPAAASSAADDTRIHLVPDQDVVDAPSIGPKTADRLKAVGVRTVADLFAADPGALAEELDVAHIRAKTIAEWQDQARLVCEVPGLRGTHAQLLVGAGYRDLRRIARAEPRQLSADVLKFVQSSDGQRILRSGGAPDIEKIVSWVHSAERAWAA